MGTLSTELGGRHQPVSAEQGGRSREARPAVEAGVERGGEGAVEYMRTRSMIVIKTGLQVRV